MPVIELALEEKVYRKRKMPLSILTDFSLRVDEGERIAIVGESGVGKSSLLNILGLLDRSYHGSYTLLGRRVSELSDGERARWRNGSIGFVLQESALIESLSIENNIRLPLLYGRPSEGACERNSFGDIVEALGISSILRKKPLECSGGEKARAVFARAVIMGPRVLLADEPTASLDKENRSKIIELMFRMSRELGTTVVTVTHDDEIARQHDRVIRLERKG